MSTFSHLTRSAPVRCAFSEESVYRDALGGAEPLRVFVCDGPIDAPDNMPAGAMRACARTGGFGQTFARPEVYR